MSLEKRNIENRKSNQKRRVLPGNGLDLCTQLLFDPVESKPVVVGDQVDRNSEMAESATATDPVEVGLGHLGEVEVDDDVDCLDVDTAGEEVTADQVTAQPGAEVMENSVTMSLEMCKIN